MDKQFTRADLMYILSVIFLLVCAVGAFFYGLKLGADRTESKYQAMLKEKEQASKEPTAYDQSYLVSFYHTIYLPYRDFQNKWFSSLNGIETRGGSTDSASVMKELAKLADEQYKAISTQTMPESSPLLIDAQKNYMKSLKLFGDAAKSFGSRANSLPASALPGEIAKDPSFSEAKNFALSAQKDYFDSIVKWNLSVNPEMKGTDLAGQNAALSIADWNQLDLNLKNDYMAGLLLKEKNFTPYPPQDLVYHVDDMIKNGQAKKMNASTIPQIADILLATGAVRQGDFLSGKNKWYASETLPLLPFFSTDK